MNHRRALLAALGCCPLLPAFSPLALAQASYPSKPIRCIVPSPAGSPIDAVGRKMFEVMSAKLGVPIIVDNKPGASGSIGAGETARSAPDGYTLMLSVGDPLIFASAALKLNYDPQKDFVLISKVATSGAVLVAYKGVKANTLKELVAETKSSPQPISYGSNGPGSSPQQVMESVAKESGARFTEIPYKGSPAAMQDLLAGEVKLAFTAPNVALPLIAEGRIKPIAVVGDQRSTVMPKVPTFVESGFDGFVFRNKVWVGLSGPAALPPAIVQKLAATAQATVADPAFRKYLLDIGFDPVGNTPEQFASEFKAEFAVIPPLIRALGVTPQ